MVKLGVRQETGNSKDNKSFKKCLDVLHKVVGKKCKTKKKNTLVSGNAIDEKNLQPGCRKFIFLIDFLEIFSLFSSLFSFVFFVFLFFFVLFFCFVFVLFFKLKIYVLIHIRLCGRVSDKKNFHPADFRKQDHFFLA